MSEVRIVDVYTPLIFNQYLDQNLLNRWKLLESGLIVTDANFNRMLSSKGRKIEMPYWKAIDPVEPNISVDDPAVKSTPQKITSDKTDAIRQSNNKSWGVMDLASDLTLGTDPIKVVANKIADYWRAVMEAKLIRTTKGIVVSNITNDSGDMVVDIAEHTANTTPVDANLISALAVIDTCLTMGDMQMDITHMGVHSLVYGRLQKLNLIIHIPDAEGRVRIPTYQNKTLLVDDSIPVVQDGFMADTTTPRYVFDTYLYGRRVFGVGNGGSKVPSEIQRLPDSGDGAGEEVLYSRRESVLSMFGINWVGATMVKSSPSYAELELGVNWLRKWDRKRIPFAVLKSNG